MDSDGNLQRTNRFMCGVVEGFYGRPWTTDQRKDLFIKMRRWGMDSYLYAPKDDYKHRAYWRELYTVEEADHLSSLITAAKDNNIRFIYAISPGLDIGYSSTKDVSALKRKLEQVNHLGCEAFAILFDDIDAEMSKADKQKFKSFAHAQVSVTNEAFQSINVNCFLFCPTQYCATRAVPNVRTSEYLKTIGAKLDLQIDIMWTGPKVISKDISVESIEELSEVIRRPPVIWDNLHANDYDQKRVFLGPYAGRSPQLISRLRGVLTNPNCEYGTNFVAIHTLAQWSRCSVDAKKKIEESMNPDAKLETETENGNSVHVPEHLEPHVYHPIVALKIALAEWLGEFYKGRTVWGPIVKPQIVSVPIPLVPSVNTCIIVTSTTNTVSNTRPSLACLVPNVPTVNCSSTVLTAIVDNVNETLIPSTSSTMMNSLVADDKIFRADSGEAVAPVCKGPDPNLSTANSSESDITELPLKDERVQVNSAAGLEPMDCNTATPPSSSPPYSMSIEREDVPMVEGSNRTSGMSTPEEGTEPGSTSVSIMNLDSELELTRNSTNHANTPSSSTMQVEHHNEDPRLSDQELTALDLRLLCDLFYLPFEHGAQGVQIMQEFQWLKANSNVIAGISSKDKTRPEVMEWYDRASKLTDLTSKVNQLATKLNNISNRELLYEIYPYIWDIRGVISLLNSYIKWLGFSKGWREAFMSGDQEPWVIRGGLTSELQRLIPVDRGTDLYMYKAPDVPSSQVYTIRPYRTSDDEPLYKVCLATFKDGLSAAEDLADFPKLAGDLKIGGYLTMNADIIFVVENEHEVVVGAAVAVLNGLEFRRKLNVSWMDMLRKMYPSPSEDEPNYVNGVISSLHSDMKNIPEDIRTSHPAELRFTIISPLADPSVPKRLMTCVLAALRAHGMANCVHVYLTSFDSLQGVFGCFVEVSNQEHYFRDFFKKLGFNELDENFMGRTF